MDISNKTIAIATHYLVYGAPQALKDYLINKKIKKIIFIAHPLLVDETRSYYEIYHSRKKSSTSTHRIRFTVNLFNYLWEFFLTIFWVITRRDTIDIFFGVDPLNAAAGVVLQKIKRVKKIIYYTIDYNPNRFNNRLLNRLYHLLDAFCLTHADCTWNVSPMIPKAREKFNKLTASSHRQITVPIGVWYNKIKKLEFEKIHKHQLLFIGHLLEKQGVQLIIEAIPDILKKIPNFHFLIVGGGEYEQQLRKLTSQLKINQYVTFTGWIKNRDTIDTIMADSACAIALYDKNKDTFTKYADPTKLKDYLSAGLPIILTDVPYNAQEIAKKRCGIIVGYNKKDLILAIISLMKDDTLLKEYRINALIYSKQFDWKKIFSQAFLNTSTVVD